MKPIAHDNPLATGILGGLKSCQRNDYCRGKLLLENLFDPIDQYIEEIYGRKGMEVINRKMICGFGEDDLNYIRLGDIC